MEEPQTSSSSSSSASPSSSTDAVIHRDTTTSGAGASSSSTSQVREEEDDHNQYHHHHNFRHPEPQVNEIGTSYRVGLSGFDETASVIRDDTWSCIIVLLTFWFFVSMTLILGVYGSETLELGPNTSTLLQPNSIFVQSIKVEELNVSNPGPVLYGFYSVPPLNSVTTWSETHSASVPADSHKEWIYYLNKGSQISISYSVSSPSTSIFLIIAEGKEGLAQWLEEPTYPNTTLSWNLVHGSGKILQDISTSDNYYISVGNLNYEDVEVQLNFTVNALLYDTSEAYYKCTFTETSCSLKISFPSGNVGVLTSPGPDQGIDNQYVKLSYGPRWATYIIGIGAMTILMLLAFNFLNKFRCNNEDGIRVQHEEFRPERAPLLSYKDDDQSSWGSSYDSASNDEGDLDELMAAGSLDGKSLRDGESNNTRRLCAICFDAPRDCFFLPCGHCVACFECATRIAEAAATCPICRRNIKKVRKIFTV
ncbi:putative transcription factor C2H2 family [Rosa chinensis]|uniref:Putative transcription factor C2H2 family n=2 Tax=Rosa chinensis TaxID=74649 RepID=A0A2P6R943_ROSCH|nr:E3 ubiquitin-protein ligase APD2 isoform X1 [Rosa chinensis]PRQ42944.1 putative transcription factor C2H2 family [Rosa chinensis]